jgi:endonuclease/exonuclease/phosphatase (EEP) superfamily protein YafD
MVPALGADVTSRHTGDTGEEQRRSSGAGVRLSGVLSAAVTVACAATAAGFLGRAWWVFELACHLRLHCYVFLGLSTGVLAALNKGKWAALAGVFALVNLAVVTPLYWGRLQSPPHGVPLRVMCANLLCINSDHEGALGYVRSADPDLVVFLEVDVRWARALQALRHDYRFHRVVPRPDSFGMAVFSRLPFQESSLVTLGDGTVPAIRADVDLGGVGVRLIAAHPVPPLGADYARRRAEYLAALARLARDRTGPLLVLGDLNTTPWSPLFHDVLRTGGLRDARRGFGIAGTWPALVRPLAVPVDHCLVSEGVGAVGVRAGPSIGSDHYPLVVDLTVAP